MSIPLLLLLVAAVGTDESPVIRVDDVALSAAELASRVATLGQGATRLSPEQRVEAVVGDAILVAEARRTGFDKSPAVQRAAVAARTRALAAHFVENGLGDGAPLSEADALRLFHLGNDTARLSLIVLATEVEAKGARERLDRGGDFTLEASRSLDPSSASNRGNTGLMSRMQLDEALAPVVFAAKAGALIGPVRLKNGFAVARVEELAIANERDLPRFRPQIEAYARRTKIGQSKAHFIQQKRKGSAVTVDDAYISALRSPIDARSLPADRVVATVGSRKITLQELLPVLAAAPSAGHGGSMALTRSANAYVDDILLAEEATRSGLDGSPGAHAAMLRAEEHALAHALGQSFLDKQPAKASSEQKMRALTEHLSQLRKQHRVWIDKPRAFAAAAPSK